MVSVFAKISDRCYSLGHSPDLYDLVLRTALDMEYRFIEGTYRLRASGPLNAPSSSSRWYVALVCIW